MIHYHVVLLIPLHIAAKALQDRDRFTHSPDWTLPNPTKFNKRIYDTNSMQYKFLRFDTFSAA